MRALLLAGLLLCACNKPGVDPIGEDRGPTPTATPPAGRHHPADWALPAAHGPAALFVQEDCRACHGATLAGGTAVGCDGCHQAGWRTSCTYCHGGTDNTTGAPPTDITGAANQADLIFKSHTKHVQTTAVASPFSCVQCHRTPPVNALDSEHWFDSTPGRAEVSFANGLSAGGYYDPVNGACGGLYCHGNGQDANGTAAYDDGPKACDSCHRNVGDTANQLMEMSGEHQRHIVGESAPCVECHSSVVNAAGAVIAPALHVNGAVENAFPSGMVFNGNTCTGTCHGDNHQNEGWQ